jgi:hypothetical protein
MNDTRRLVRALRGLLDGLDNPEYTAPSFDAAGCVVLPVGEAVLDRALSRVWVAFSGPLGRWMMVPPEAGTLDARRFGALLRLRAFIGERRPLPERAGDTTEARAARAAVGVWVRRRVAAGAVIPSAVADAVRDALDLLTMPDATGSARAELPKREPTKGNAAAWALARFLEVAIQIRDDADGLVQRTKPDTPERHTTERYLHRLAGEHFEEREHPGSDELYRRAESLRGLRTDAKVKAATLSRGLAVEVEDRCAAIIDAAISLTGNLAAMRAHSAEFAQAWAKLNDATLDALPLVDSLWKAEPEPGGDAAGLEALREGLARLSAAFEAGAKPGRKPKRRKPAEGERLTDDENAALAAVREHGNPHAAAKALGVPPATLDRWYKAGIAKLPAEYRAEFEPKPSQAGRKQAMPTDRRGGESLSADSDRRRR